MMPQATSRQANKVEAMIDESGDPAQAWTCKSKDHSVPDASTAVAQCHPWQANFNYPFMPMACLFASAAAIDIMATPSVRIPALRLFTADRLSSVYFKQISSETKGLLLNHNTVTLL
jgi:hypothetical protein